MALKISEIELYQLLEPKLGEVEAESLVNYVGAKLNNRHELDSNLLATREDLVKKTGKLENKIAELQVRIAKTEARLILWMCAAFIAMTAIIGLYFK
ncbi:MAG: hypothetical protein PHD73_10240 [Sediminibacterium sp.]|nr:hypothetical protein [Sediminibacterium sp.]